MTFFYLYMHFICFIKFLFDVPYLNASLGQMFIVHLYDDKNIHSSLFRIIVLYNYNPI